MVERKKSLTTRWFTEVWNQQRADAIDELLAADAKVYGLGPVIVGPGQFRPFHARMIAAFPDLAVELHDVIGEHNLTFRGTHRGDSLAVRGDEQTGRRHRHVHDPLAW